MEEGESGVYRGPASIAVPPSAVELAMKKAEAPKNVPQAIADALANPLGGKDFVPDRRRQRKTGGPADGGRHDLRHHPAGSLQGKNGFMVPLLRQLSPADSPGKYPHHRGNRTHPPQHGGGENRDAGPGGAEGYTVLDHDCEDGLPWSLWARRGRDGSLLNKVFQEADIKIVTGLTESHFMAVPPAGGRPSARLGRPADDPEIPHSPDFLESEKATNLVFEGNPCHEEALAIAKTVGVDFTITATLDSHMRLTGIFAGDLERVLDEAVKKIRTYVEIPVAQEFDIVLTHGGTLAGIITSWPRPRSAPCRR